MSMSMYYLRLDGFAGSSTHPKYRGWIELQSSNYLYGDSRSPYTGGFGAWGGAPAKSNWTGLSASVIMDQTAPALFAATATGRSFSRGALAAVTNRANRTESEWARWLLTEILIVSIQTSGSTFPPQALLTLAFSKVN